MDALLRIGLTNAVLAALLALAVAAVGRFCRPALRHGLWLLVLLKLVTPSFVPLPVFRPTGSPPAAAAEPGQQGPALSLRGNSSPARKEVEVRPVGNVDRPRPVAFTPAPSENPDGTRGISWQGIVLSVWLAGSLSYWGMAAYRIRRFQGVFQHATPAPRALTAQVRELARRLGLARCPSVWLVPAPFSPCVWALGRTAHLLLPAALWERLTPPQREALLVHELAHLRRGDPWVRRLELVALGLYWWHPVAWWARRELHEAGEQCCDAWVVWALPDAAPAYAAALVETVAFLARPRSALPLAASGVGHVLTLKRRLTMILHGTPPRALSGPGLLALLALGVLLLPLLPTRAELPAPKPKDRPPATTTEPAPRRTEKPTVTTTTLEAPPAPSPKAEKPTIAAGPRDRAEQVEQVRDEIELLEVQRQAKQAEVREAHARWQKTAADLKRLQNLVAKGAASKEDLDQAQADAQIRQAQLEGKEALLREVEVRLKQAQRRLGRLQPTRPRPPSRPKPAAAPPTAAKTRLREIEKKLDALLEDVKTLRQDLRLGPPEPVQRPREFTSRRREFVIPFQAFDPTRFMKVFLYYSTDEGQTWKVGGVAAPGAEKFRFRAPKDGDYWFALQALDKQGQVTPAGPIVPLLKIRVRADKE